MIVIAHQAKSQRASIKTIECQRNDTHKRLTISVILKNRLPPVATRRDVIHRPGKFDTQRSSHMDMLMGELAKGKA